jgi:hypothetical protein
MQLQGRKLWRVTEPSETSVRRGFTLETAEQTGFLPCKPNVGRPRSEYFSGINLVPVKNAIAL